MVIQFKLMQLIKTFKFSEMKSQDEGGKMIQNLDPPVRHHIKPRSRNRICGPQKREEPNELAFFSNDNSVVNLKYPTSEQFMHRRKSDS